MSKCVLQFTLQYVFTPHNKTCVSKRVMYLIISIETKGFCSKNHILQIIISLAIKISIPKHHGVWPIIKH